MKTGISIVLLTFFASCSRHLEDKEYVAYIKSAQNGIRKEIVADQIVYNFQYLPTRMILMQEHLQKEESRKRELQLKGTMWFTIGLRCLHSSENPLKSNISGVEEYNMRLDYFLNDAVHDIFLRYDNHKLFPISYHFESNYGLTPIETIVVAFEIPDGSIDDDATLVFEDKIFKNGIIKAFFPKEKLSKANKI